MKVTDIKLIDIKKVNSADATKVYNKIKKDTENFNEDYLEIFEDEILEFVKLIKTNRPEAFTKSEPKPRTPRTPRTPKAPTPPIPREGGGEDLVAQVMEDYNLTRDKALRLIALREEAIELKKENLEKLVDRLDKSEFYEGRNKISRSPIDKGRTRDLGKDSKQGALTSAEERKMTGTPFKRISKAGRKNQFGETTGGKVYYEYRQNRRDVDNKIKLATGGVVGQDVTYRYYDEQRTGEIIRELPNGYEVASKWGTTLVEPKEIISINAPKKKRFSFFKNGGGVRNYDAETKLAIFNGYKDIDKCEKFLDYDGSVSPYRIIRDAIVKGWVVPNEVTEDLLDEAITTSKEIEADDVEEIGTSDMNYYVWITLKEAGFDMKVENNKYFRADKMEKGGGVGIPNADKMFHLPYEIAVYVPSTKDVDKTITATELRARVKEVEKYLAETFGGFTSSEKVGGYLSSKSSIITEKVVPVTAFSSLNDFTANKSKLINKMSVWAKKWGQEAIGFEFEGDLYYVPQKFKSGGTLKATYIPRRDIKLLTTVWGNNIKGKDLIDGAYTKRKDIKTAPKVARTQFEDETFEFKKGGKLDATYIPKRDIKSIETIWGNKISGKDLIDGAYTKRTNIKTAPKVARTMFEDETFEYAKGGRLDLFEDYENIPSNVQKVLDKYAENFGDDYSGMSYQDMTKMHDEIYKLGYTFDSGLDNQAFGLRPIGVNLNELVGYEDEENDEMKNGGLVAYANDDYETRIATFKNLAEAKKFAKANKWKYESIIFEDEKLDNIVVNKDDTFKDIDFLFSN